MKTLQDARTLIDSLDTQLVALLAARFQVVDWVGAFKAQSGDNVEQPARMQEVKDRVAAMAEAKGLDGDLLRAIYTLIIDHAHVREHAILAKKDM